jgi:hypothetical protein
LLILVALLIQSQPARPQQSPKIEIGSILALNYKNSESGESPLVVNDGDGSFNNDWVLLLGAEINESISLYAEIQTARGITFVNYGLSAIYRPARWKYINFEAGKFLAPYGTFLGRRWASENPLIGFPLMYEFTTALSAFDLPANNSELLRARGHGGRVKYHPEPTANSGAPQIRSGHIPQPGSGLRILSREVYLTGAQVFGVAGRFRYYAGVANGALSNPADLNNSNGVQLHGRAGFSPVIGLDLGSSISWGAYLDKSAVTSQLQPLSESAEDFRQTTLGFDLSYSIAHVQFFSELILNRWQSPFIAEHLDARAFYLEGKYTFLTRFFLAARFSVIDFSDIADPQDVDADGAASESWEYDIRQWEVGLGWRINRNALIKAAGQFNRTREVVRDPADDLFALQAVVFF